MLAKAHCFTLDLPGRANAIYSEAQVLSSIAPSARSGKVRALWDTGATGTVLSPEIVAKCALQPISMTKVHTANGESSSGVYLVDVQLPNNVIIQRLRVTSGNFTSGNFDMLIGMDIISQGDFAITRLGGQTTFSFRVPSMERIDFSASPKKALGRKDKCPCGSGDKYKACCMGR